MGKKASSATSALKGILVNIFLGANLATLCLLWTCCATTWVNPSMHPRISVVGLLFPIIMLLNLLFVPFWLIYKPRILLVPILGMSICGSFILDYFPLNYWSSPKNKTYDFTVFTWNTYYLENCPIDSVSFLSDYLLKQEVDVACLQEATHGSIKFGTVADSMRSHGYSVESERELFILSRHPILSRQIIPIESASTNRIMMADIQFGNDTLTVINVHLESNLLSSNDKEEYGNIIEARERDKVKTEAAYLTGKLSKAAYYRGLQTKRIVSILDSLPETRRILLCGDFNDTPISYTYQQVNRRLDNAYRHGGRGVGISFNMPYFPVRIDNIFHSNHWVCTKAHIVHSLSTSDHYPMLARLKNREN